MIDDIQQKLITNVIFIDTIIYNFVLANSEFYSVFCYLTVGLVSGFLSIAFLSFSRMTELVIGFVVYHFKGQNVTIFYRWIFKFYSCALSNGCCGFSFVLLKYCFVSVFGIFRHRFYTRELVSPKFR